MKFDADYYKIIGVPPDASARDIRQAWREKCKILHPDKNLDKVEWATKCMAELNNAYDVLKDETNRTLYDKFLKETKAPQSTPGESFWSNTQSWTGTSSSRAAPRSSTGASTNGNQSYRGSTFGRQEPPRYSESSRTKAKPSTDRGSTGRQRSYQGFSSGARHYPSGSRARAQTGQTRAGSNGFPRDKSNHRSQPHSQGTHPKPASSTKTSKASRNKSSSKPPRVFGMRQDGQPCQRCIQHGRYCYQHVNQDPLSNKTTDKAQKKPQPSGPHSSSRIFGVRQDGQPCLCCLKQGSYCHWHAYQAPKSTQSYSRTKFPGTNKSKGSHSKVYGVRRDGQPCLRCCKQRGFCYQHKDQE